jgi:hypothetical protein
MNAGGDLVHYLAAAEWTVFWRGWIKVTVESAVGECEMLFTQSADERVRVPSLIHLSLGDDLGERPSMSLLLPLICDSTYTRIVCYPPKGGDLLVVIVQAH